MLAPLHSIPFLHFYPRLYKCQLLKPLPRTNGFSSRSSFSTPLTLSRNVSAAASMDVDTFTKNSGYIFELKDSELESLTEYNASLIASIYRKNPLILLRRCLQIATTLGRWFAVRYMDIIIGRSERMFKFRAAELRMILVELGPAYVKIAQAISSRPDIIPQAYLDELSLLQDQITPFSSSIAFDTIEEELGLPLNVLFSEISLEPVAAASLGQVYLARLYPNGVSVAVKVQRPGVQAAISLDILILRFLAGLIRKAWKFNTDLQAIVDEWASSLFREMDYKQEATNGLRFRQLYGGLQDVMVPKMYTKQTTRRVLVMEWVKGEKLSEVKDLYLVEVGVFCSFNQLLEYGFYHADPHPGNLLRTYDGKLAYLDFGMMGEFREEFRDGFIEACLHLVNRDFDALAIDFVTLGLLPPSAEKEAVTKALTGVFKSAVAKGVRGISFGDLLGNLGSTMYKFKFQIPSYFSLVIRSLAVLEGIAISLNPEYKVLGSAYPWIAKKVLFNSSPKLQSSLQSLLYREGFFRIDRFESLLMESIRARTEVSQKLKMEDTDSRAVFKEILSFTLSAKGTFMRNILLQESAKGFDALGLATMDSLSSSAIARLPFVSILPSATMTDEDINSLRALQRFVPIFVWLLKNNEHGSDDSMANSDETYWLVSFHDILPILSVIPELPPESQQTLFHLPMDFSQRLISRIFSRTIRRIFI